MNKPARTPAPAASGVRPADRLGFTLFLAALVHVALILGLSFSFAEPGQISKTLEITLSTFKSAEKPKEADFLAQNIFEPLGLNMVMSPTLAAPDIALPYDDNHQLFVSGWTLYGPTGIITTPAELVQGGYQYRTCDIVQADFDDGSTVAVLYHSTCVSGLVIHWMNFQPASV